MLSRHWISEQLGIIQWSIRRPEVFKGGIVIKLPDNIRLLLIANLFPPENHPIVADIARSLALTTEQIARVTPDQAMMLPNNLSCHCWWIAQKAKRHFNKISLVTSSFSTLQSTPTAKRALWHQISMNQYYLTNFSHL